MLGYVVFRFTPKILDIDSAERYCRYVKTTKSAKQSEISSDVSEKQSIVYTSDCIESNSNAHNDLDRIQGAYHSRNVWYYDWDNFDRQLEKWCLDTVIKKKLPDEIRDFRTYI